MVDIKDFGEYKIAWCPGCGNFPLLDAVKKALVDSNLAPHQVIFVSGIGQAAKAPHYLNANLFNGLHEMMYRLEIVNSRSHFSLGLKSWPQRP